MYTVGTTLKEKREAMGLSINDIVKATKIDKLYIDAIENSDFSFFENQDFYHQVFVGSYAEFLGLNKNEMLGQLQDDMVKGKEELKEIKAQKAAEAPVQMDTTRVKKYLTEYEEPKAPVQSVKSEPIKSVQSDPKVEVQPQAVAVEPQPIVQEPVAPVQPQPEVTSNYEQTNDEINQLIQDINQNSNVNIDEYFDDSTSSFVQESIPDVPRMDSIAQPIEQPAKEELLNSAIFDEIEKINNQVETKNELEDSLPEITEAMPARDFELDKPLESTAVIDLTSGIEIETVSNNEVPVFSPAEMVDEQLNETSDLSLTQANSAILNEVVTPTEEMEQPVPSLDEFLNKDENTANDSFVNPFNQDISVESGVSDSKPQFKMEPAKETSVLEELEKTIHDSKVLTTDPDKTAMDLKIAKALGDSKVEIDKETSKKVKRDRIIDVILIVLILALVAYFGFMVYSKILS